MRKRKQCPNMIGVAPVILFVFVMSAWGQSLTGPDNMSSVGSLREMLESADSREEQLSAWWALADVYREQGKYREALRSIEKADAVSQTKLEQTLTALRWSGIAIELGLYEESSALLTVANEGKSLLDESSAVALELELGHLAVEQKRLNQAVGHFDVAISQANRAQLPFLEAKSRVNALRARMDNQDLAGLEDRLAELHRLVGELGPGDQSAFLLLASGDLHRRAVNEFRSDQALLGVAHDDYLQAREYAESVKTRSYVLGFLGALYEDEGRLNEALRLTSEAVFYAQTARADEQLYRWEWQQGRIFKAQGRLADAQKAYQRAVTVLSRVRPNFVLGSRKTFETMVAPVYTEYADVLLLQSIAAPSQNQSQTLLTEVRNQLETLKQGTITTSRWRTSSTLCFWRGPTASRSKRPIRATRTSGRCSRM